MFTVQAEAIVTLSAHEKALLSGSDFKRLVFSPDQKKIAAVFVKDGNDVIAVLDKKNLSPFSASDKGENFKVFNLFWADNNTLIFNKVYSEGYLKKYGKYKSVMYSLKYNGRSKQIYPPIKDKSAWNHSFYQSLTAPELVDKHYIIVSEAYGRMGEIKNRLMKVNIRSGTSKVYRDMGLGRGHYILDNKLTCPA